MDFLRLLLFVGLNFGVWLFARSLADRKKLGGATPGVIRVGI
jgi:hypothetical protein